MCSGSQAMSVRIENVPTSVHSPGGPGIGSGTGTGTGGSTMVSGGIHMPVAGSIRTVSGGGAIPLSEGQLHRRSGKSSCSATARKLRLAPSMVRVTGVAWPVRRTISAACRSASAVGE